MPIRCGCALVLLAGLAAGPASALVLHGPTPYRSAADAPWDTEAPDFTLIDFEAGIPSGIGVTASTGFLNAPNAFTDSVDGDDGAIDGRGNDGHSLLVPASVGGTPIGYISAPEGTPIEIRFEFATPALAQRAGLVWTDGQSSVRFEAFDAAGALLGGIDGSHHDGREDGATGEDRFYGAEHLGGISAIRLVASGGLFLEVDHVQFGPAPGSVPEPALLLLLGGPGLVLWRRLRGR